MSASVQAPTGELHRKPTHCDSPEEPLAVDEGPTQAEPPETTIESSRGWQLINVRELWKFRELIGFLVWRDVKIRYKQTALGAAWAVLQPVMMMVVMTLFFGHRAQDQKSPDELPYHLFVYAGLLPWIFFATAIATAANSIVGAERLITKVYFPRLAIPFASVGAAVVDFVIAFGLLAVFMVWYGIVPGPGILLMPLIFGIMVLAAGGVGTLLAALNVSYRDFRYVVPFMIQVWMFATPTIYLPSAGEGGGVGRLLLDMNPMAGLIAAFRASCLGGPIPWTQLATSTIVVVLVFLAACFFFRKVEDSFADII